MPRSKLAHRVLRRAVYEVRSWLWKIHGKLRRSVTVRTKQGTLTVSAADTAIGKSLYCCREYELDLTLKVAAFLRDIRKTPLNGKGTVLDIGANIGVICVGMIEQGLVDKAIAIEPDPHNFALLEHNVRQNGLEDRVICLRRAVSDASHVVAFELSDNDYGDHRVRSTSCATDSSGLFGESQRPTIEVEADCLDHLIGKAPQPFAENIALIWVDVQGHEGYVFRGGTGIFSRGIPVVAEIWPYGIARSGMSRQEFCAIAERIWSDYWVLRRGKFVRYPISVLGALFDELGDAGDFDNVIFT